MHVHSSLKDIGGSSLNMLIIRSQVCLEKKEKKKPKMKFRRENEKWNKDEKKTPVVFL